MRKALVVLVGVSMIALLSLSGTPVSATSPPAKDRCFVAIAHNDTVVDARGHRWVCARITGIAPYDPAWLIVSPGTIVNWTNMDSALPHTVSAMGSTSDETFHNVTLPGQKASINFTKVGTTHISCRINALHTAVMHAVVEVKA